VDRQVGKNPDLLVESGIDELGVIDAHIFFENLARKLAV